MEKDFKNNYVTSVKKSHSKHSGIGRPYFEKHYAQILRLGFIPFNGGKLSIPRYFEKIAHKHYCHFYKPSVFSDTSSRKALYRPFLELRGPKPDRLLADLFGDYLERKKERVQELEAEWHDVISQLTLDQVPDFLKANQNALYDLQTKQNLERF